jgi:glucan phosphorylase
MPTTQLVFSVLKPTFMNATHDAIAYFSMEIGLEAGMPTYNGGLGVLAGDTIRAAADLKVPMVAVTLLHRKVTAQVGSVRLSWLQVSDRQQANYGRALATSRN